jgi:uridine kinase
MSERAEVVTRIATLLCANDLGHPIRVAIDGVTASGKSTLAGELSEAASKAGRPVIHVTMDGFHHHRERRYRLGRMSPEGYYNDAYNFAAFARHVLIPLGPGGDGRYRDRIIDLASDERIDEASIKAPADAILIIDGSFLQRSDLVSLWDHRIFVNTTLAVARARGTHRDAKQLGGLAQAELMYDLRYHAAARLYLDAVHPAEIATLVVDNDDLSKPGLRALGGKASATHLTS